MVDLREAVVAGVATAGSWRLPGKVDVWLLEPDTEMVPDRAGFVVAHLTSSGARDLWSENGRMTARTPDGSMDDFLCGVLSGANPGAARHLPLRGFSRLPRVARYNIASPGRVPIKLPEAFLVDKTSPLELFDRQDRAALAHCLSRVARSCLSAFNPRNVFIGVYPVSVFLFDLPLWPALGSPGPAATVPCVSWKALPSCTGRSAFQNISGLEWNGADLRRRSRFAARSRNADKLVQHSTVAVSRSFVGSSICRAEPGLHWLLLKGRMGRRRSLHAWLDMPGRAVSGKLRRRASHPDGNRIPYLGVPSEVLQS